MAQTMVTIHSSGLLFSLPYAFPFDNVCVLYVIVADMHVQHDTDSHSAQKLR